MENNILNKEKAAELMKLLSEKQQCSEYLENVKKIKDEVIKRGESYYIRVRIGYAEGSTGIEREKEMFVDGYADSGKGTLNGLSQSILFVMEECFEHRIKYLESCLWDKFRYTEDTVPEEKC